MTEKPEHSTSLQKLCADSIPTHPKPNSSRRQPYLNTKASLGTSLHGVESQELAALEEENMKTIEKVYQRLRDDEEIQAQIEMIKAHPWVRVVEGE